MNMGMQQQPGMQLQPWLSLWHDRIGATRDPQEATVFASDWKNSHLLADFRPIVIRRMHFISTPDVAQAKHDDDSKHGRLLSCARAQGVAYRTLWHLLIQPYAGHAAAEFMGKKNWEVVTSVPVRYHPDVRLMQCYSWGRLAEKCCACRVFTQYRCYICMEVFFLSTPMGWCDWYGDLRWATTWHCYTPKTANQRSVGFGASSPPWKWSEREARGIWLFFNVTSIFDRRTSWVCFFIPGLLWLVRCHGATSDFEPPTRQTPPKASLALLPKQYNSNPTPLFAVVLCVARKTNQNILRFFIVWPYAVGAADFQLWM